MKRRAQIINPKDAGFCSHGWGLVLDKPYLRQGMDTGGLALHLANVLGENGTLVSVENRPEHAEVGRENMMRANALKEFPNWTLIEGDIGEVSFEDVADEFDAIILDLPEPWPVISKLSKKIQIWWENRLLLPGSSQVNWKRPGKPVKRPVSMSIGLAK